MLWCLQMPHQGNLFLCCYEDEIRLIVQQDWFNFAGKVSGRATCPGNPLFGHHWPLPGCTELDRVASLLGCSCLGWAHLHPPPGWSTLLAVNTQSEQQGEKKKAWPLCLRSLEWETLIFFPCWPKTSNTTSLNQLLKACRTSQNIYGNT